MTELEDVLAELGISHYLQIFTEQGFDTWETVLDITESDFDALDVKLGHRRKIQRKIATSKGWSSDRPLASPRNTPTDDRVADEFKAAGAKSGSKDGNEQVPGAKRKYRRHPKPDDNAPERPPSAYVIFSNKMREDIKARRMTFTEIAKLVGENWQNLSPAEKEPYEQQAFAAKDRYNTELVEYKKTDQYVLYSQYLVEFKARHSNNQQGSESEASKRPKLDSHLSASSNGSSTTSQITQQASDASTIHARTEQNRTSTNPWSLHEGHSIPMAAAMPNLTSAFTTPSFQGMANPFTELPGYRDSMHSVLPWRDAQRTEHMAHNQQQTLHRVPLQRQPSDSTGAPSLDANPQPHTRRAGHNAPVPLLLSETTNMSTASSGSTLSYFSPPTPVDLPIERVLPVPSLFSQKPSLTFGNQLPPIRPLSESPQIATPVSQQFTAVMQSTAEYPSSPSMAPLRTYSSATHQVGTELQGIRDSTYPALTDDTILDPVSALLRAGEIVSRNSKDRFGV